ncbi:MFS transporter [Aquabacterium sp.]|uniref:MFS transporter n=1 Tax=Aquabacterium sp. TaxID=1872578 RepID=UPI003D6C905B
MSKSIPISTSSPRGTAYKVIAAISFTHLLNDMMQSLLVAIYPVIKLGLHLSFGQIGLITLTYQITASLLQPLIGLYTDRKPQPYSLPIGMGFTLVGLLLLSHAYTFELVLLSAALVGMGSSVFHPESSRVARMAAGQQPGLAQSLFQVGGNLGSAIGPLLAALIIVPHGQGSVAWFSVAALIGVFVLLKVGRWYQAQASSAAGQAKVIVPHGLSRAKVGWSLGILGVLVFSKYFYMASLSSYYTFYLMEKFHLPVDSAQLYLFAFLFAVAVGTIVGGPVGDRIGRKRVIWISILGVAPFTMMLPHANLFWTGILSVVIGLILASAFSAILVYAQELVPGKVGAISGLFFGFAFGMGGIGAAVLGHLADATSVAHVYQLCAYLPLIGLLTAWLPNVAGPRR